MPLLSEVQLSDVAGSGTFTLVNIEQSGITFATNQRSTFYYCRLNNSDITVIGTRMESAKKKPRELLRSLTCDVIPLNTHLTHGTKVISVLLPSTVLE